MKLTRITHQFKSKLKITVQQITKARIMRFLNEVYFYGAEDEDPGYLNTKKPRT